MGIFDRIFRTTPADSSSVGLDETEEQLECDSCGALVDADEVENGECEDCRAADYTGATYCCGAIYEEGEDTCMSCGEPL